MSERAADADRALLRRAARAVAIQAAAAVAVVIVVVAGAVFLADERQQSRQADALTRDAWTAASSVARAPQGTWLVVVGPAGRRAATEGTPGIAADIDPAALPDGPSRLERSGHELAVWTGDRSIGRVSAVADVSAREVEERRLLVSLVVAGIVGAIGAAAVGALIGRRAVRPLGEAMALQRRFVADASHELRAPLTVLLTRAQLLSRHLAGQVSVERQAELDRLVTDARNVGEVVTDLLHSVELGQHPDRGVPVGMSALAADVVDSMQPLAAERGVQLTAGPPLAEDAVVGVPVALRRALTALVDNALSHTPSGGHVDVGLARDAEVVSVRVRDDGVGLDPGQAEQLVQRFARGTTREPGRRLGIGLALVDEIAAAHGGTLVLDGEPGRGACVELRLPRRSADGAEPL